MGNGEGWTVSKEATADGSAATMWSETSGWERFEQLLEDFPEGVAVFLSLIHI